MKRTAAAAGKSDRMNTTLKLLQQQTAIVLTACVFAPMVCAAEAVPASLRQCVTIADPAGRLACFDAALQQLGVTAGAATQGSTAASAAVTAGSVAAAGTVAATAAPALTPEQKFGATGELKQKQEPKPEEPLLEQLTAIIKDVRQAPDGRYVVTLDNGQVWRQITPADMLMKAGEPVTIHPRTLGSFWLVDASGRGSRFKRIQ